MAVTVAILLVGAHRGGATAHTVATSRPRRSGSAATSTSSAPPTTAAPATSTTSSSTTTTTLPPRPTGVGLARCTFVDTTRSTYDYATGKVLPGRQLPTEIRYPTAANGATDLTGEQPGAPPVNRAGGWPTIFFAPGYNVTPGTYAALLDAWVRAGFVVVAPSFPDTNPTAVAAARFGYPEDDLTNQPADLAFVIRSSLAASAGTTTTCPALRGLVLPSSVGVAGQSDGGDTVALLAYGTSGPGTGAGAGLPIGAAAVLSGSEWYGDTYGAPAGAPPLLITQSPTDQCNPPQQSVQLYDAVPLASKWFVTLGEADHLGPYDGDAAAAFDAVVAATTGFFKLELAGATPSVASLAAAVAPAGDGATVTGGPTAPALPTLPFVKAACARPPGIRTS